MTTDQHCATPGHEDRPATVSLRLPGMDDWPASPNVCGPCADEAMYPLAVKADRALRAEHQRLRESGLTEDEINARLHPGMVEVLNRAGQAGGSR